MQSQTKVFLTFGILVVMIGGLYFFSDWFSKVTGYQLGEDQKIRFIQCLNEKNTVYFRSEGCIECAKQEELIGARAFALVNSFTCTTESCANIKQVPAWQIGNSIFYGKKSFDELSAASGCPLR